MHTTKSGHRYQIFTAVDDPRSVIEAYLGDPDALGVIPLPNNCVAVYYRTQDSPLTTREIILGVVKALRDNGVPTNRAAEEQIAQALGCVATDIHQMGTGHIKDLPMKAYPILLSLVTDLDSQLADHLRMRIKARRT